MRRRVDLLIAGRCNLRCSYCYQDRTRPRARMNLSTARAAVDALLRWSPEDLGLSFSGGEPLLEAELLREVVEYLDWRRPEGSPVEYTVTTNGTLLTPELTGFLLDHGFRVQISFDGVRAAQELRAPGSFDVVDGALRRLLAAHADSRRGTVAVEMTLTVAAIPRLAESVRYLVGLGLEHIQVGPVVTWEPGWCDAAENELRRQVEQVLADSLELFERERRSPVAFLRPTVRRRHRPFVCSAASGDTVAVDSDGRVWGCHLFASSLQHLPHLAREVSEVLDLGSVDDPGLDNRLTHLPRAGRSLRLLTQMRDKLSSQHACGECPHVNACLVCPLATCHIPGNADPRRVPDQHCAFNRITLEAAAAYRERTLEARLLEKLERLEGPLRRINAALSGAS
jgi:sulfatase maturation enzyme AslB (radical SAM superfamily)